MSILPIIVHGLRMGASDSAITPPTEPSGITFTGSADAGAFTGSVDSGTFTGSRG